MTPEPNRTDTTHSPSAERTKVLSVRLTLEEFEQLLARATQVGVGPSTLARTLVRSGLHLDADTRTRAAPGASNTPSSTSSLEHELQGRLDGPPSSGRGADLLHRVAVLEARLDALTSGVPLLTSP